MAYKTPGVYIVEKAGPKTLQPVGTDVAAFLGQAPDAGARLGEAVPVNNWTEFCKLFAPKGATSTFLANAVYGFFLNKGSRCFIVNVPDSDPIAGSEGPRTGLKLLEEKDEISIVAAPGRTDPASHVALQAHCELMGDRMYICDPPDVKNTELLKTVELAAAPPKTKEKDKDKDPTGGAFKPPSIEGAAARPSVSMNGFGTVYFPWLVVNDALTGNLVEVPPSGHVAGIWSSVAVHRAPANKIVNGATDLTYKVTGPEQGDLNSRGVNCIRYFSDQGLVVWGARTLAEESSEWRYVPVRRLLIMIEQTILRNTRFAVFEPNDRTLWRTIRSAVTGFLRNVYRDGALMGATPEEAFFVKCDEETNPQESIDLGQVVTVIGVAPVKPAEFIIFQIGQNAAGAVIQTL
jgi:uncharacterized protein